MKINKFYVSASAQEYIKDQFKDRVQFEVISENCIGVIFQDEITSSDITDIFFAGAYWGINKSNTEWTKTFKTT